MKNGLKNFKIMKSNTLLTSFFIPIFLFALLFLLINSQNLHAQRFIGGIHGGLGASQIDGDDYGGYHKFSFEVGGLVQYPINKYISLQMEFNFAQKGSKETPNNKKGTTDMYSATLGYLEVPVLFQAHWRKFSIDVGPSFCFLLYSQEKRDGYETMGLDWKRFSLAGIAGLRYQFTKHIAANFRFNYSLFNSRKRAYENDSFFSPYGQYNSVILFSVEYRFNPQQNHATSKN